METDAPGEAWRTTSGAEPGAVKAASPVLNGEDEETGRKALRLVLTPRKMRDVHLRFSFDRSTGQRSHLSLGYCWPTYFNVLGVLFLGEVSSAFLPSKKASWTLKFRLLGVGQQYPGVCERLRRGNSSSAPPLVRRMRS